MVGVVALGVHASRSRKATADECNAVLDRYVEMSIDADPELAGLTDVQRARVREMKKAVKKGDPSYAAVERDCAGKLTRGEVDCARAAKTPGDWEACIE